ncbi:MAG: hypothetical protein HY744_01805 [Deltaproteobacteria bacterium]|nr:hypothetical protein [Deltaproteobacteria bacterium]
MLWIACPIAALALLVALVCAPLRLRLTLQGRGDPDGHWAVGAGAQLGPLSVSAVAARGARPGVRVPLRRWTLWPSGRSGRPGPRRSRWRWRRSRRKPPQERPGLAARYRALARRIDPGALAVFLAGEHRRLRLESLVAELEYSFADIALTGKMCGALYALGGVLPARFAIRHVPGWESIDRARAEISGTIKLWPGLFVLDALVFAVKNVRLRSREADAPWKTRSTKS